MIRAFFYLAILAVLSLLAASLADTPGAVTLDWLGYRIETSVLALLIFMLGASVVIAGLWRIWSAVTNSPRRMRRWQADRRQRLGYKALTQGMVAVAAGDAIEARRPVAWVAPADTGADPSTMETACLVDATGVMIKPQGFEASYTSLPVVYGVPTEQWRLGDKIEMPELLAALDLLGRAAERTNPEVRLRAVDISKGWCITAWNDPQTRLTFGPEDLPSQLDRLQLILLHVGQTSRRVATVNLIPARNTPVTFVGEAPPAEAATAPTTAKNR